jgi:elongation factor G
MRDLAQEYRTKLLEAVSDFDDEIMELYLEGEEIPSDKIRAAIRKATVAVHMIPVTCGTSYRNKGIQKLLDAIVDYLPSPLDIPPSRAKSRGPARLEASRGRRRALCRPALKS